MTERPRLHLKVLLFTRYPEPGRAKTRLIPALGAAGAARLQRCLTEEVVRTLRLFKAAMVDDAASITIRICYTGAGAADFRAWLGDDLEYQRQAEGDLGQRLRQALDLAFRPRLANQSCDGLECGIPPHERRTGEETEIALLLGADLPGLTVELLQEAVTALTTSDLVLGPALDGGYYLLGSKEPQPEMFEGIDWGSDRVQEQTLEQARRLGLPYALLPAQNDLDRPEELAELAADPRFAEVFGQLPRLTVIIPTLNEAAGLEESLRHLQREAGRPELEILVVDGGSQDSTLEIARQQGAEALAVSGGRAAQLNAGAARARGDYLLFLHADTRPPADYPAIIERTLADPATVAGAFRLRIDGVGAALRLVEWGANLRSRRGRLPYGDQGLFLSKRVFAEVGGFPPLAIMEDFALVRRLGKRGRVVTRPEAARTSARRWRQLGVFRTFLINQLMVLGLLIGVDPERLARFYRQQRGK